MVTPIANEAAWLTALGDLPVLVATEARVVVIAPHPDDETLAAGGFIAAQRARGVEVLVVAVTDGDAAYVAEGDPALASARRQEQTEALARRGVGTEQTVRLGLPDSRVAEHELEVVERVRPYVTAKTHIVAPWPGDFHPDHEACGRAAREIAKATGARLSFWFFWTWHRGTPEVLRGLALEAFPLTEEDLRAKGEALACHRSQLVWEQGEPILPEDLLAPARRRFEVFLPA